MYAFKLYMKHVYSSRNTKIILILSAIVIAVFSLVASNILVHDLTVEEHSKMEVWADAMRELNNAGDNTDLSLVLKVLNENNTIPVIVMDSKGNVQTYRNIDISARNRKDSSNFVADKGKQLIEVGKVIKIFISGSPSDYINVCYDDSIMIKRLRIYPLVQLGIVTIFVVIAIFALLTYKKAEQNRVWLGLSKETAHQLGTPISSLMAWTEIFKETYPNDKLIYEMEKDVQRLQLIADRFSKIGSLPELKVTNLIEIMDHVVDYMALRTSSKVKIIKKFPQGDVLVKINLQLFEWAIENVLKNAVDAIKGEGIIILAIHVMECKVFVDISDTGKGIKHKDLNNIFKPGFTTKDRGWGLGLSLAKRMIEEYHKGKIYVKSSDPVKGTIFRIELSKISD